MLDFGRWIKINRSEEKHMLRIDRQVLYIVSIPVTESLMFSSKYFIFKVFYLDYIEAYRSNCHCFFFRLKASSC